MMSRPTRTHAAVVLIYHRITETETDPWALNVSPRNFASQLDSLRKAVHLAPLSKIAAGAAAGRLGGPAAAITFDDGYADNFQNAKPLLDRYEAPATFFLVTGAIDACAEYWWDELDRLVLLPARLPDRLELDQGGIQLLWQSERTAFFRRFRYRRWRTWRRAPDGRGRLYTRLYELCRSLPAASREAVLDALRRWAGVGRACRSTHRTLTSEEAGRLGSGTSCDLGCHTATHPVLAQLTEVEQDGEIRAGKAGIAKLGGRPPAAFSYPFGRQDDFGPATVELVRGAGFLCACANLAGRLTATTDPYAIPRVQPPDCSGPELVRRLAAFL